MKKLLILFLFIPTIIFAQSSKSYLTFSAGINIPLSQVLVNTTNTSYDASIFRESASGNSGAWGLGVFLDHFKGKEGPGNSKWILALGGFYKLQDNSVQPDEFQPFVKTGAGLGIIGLGENTGHPEFPTINFVLDAGLGTNYLITKENKIFIETGYRISPMDKNPYSAFYISLGFSTLLK